MKLAVQLDFDGTVTLEDVSFLLLDTYAGPGWREYLKDYTDGKISAGVFNKKVFGMVKAGKKTMTDFVLSSPRVTVRPGFKEFIDFCSQNGIEVVIVSHGLIFYIEAILKKLGLAGLEVHAAENVFSPGGMKVRYLGPDGRELEAGSKEAWTAWLVKRGFSVIYVGDGSSDVLPAAKADYVCAAGALLESRRKNNLPCVPFNDFFDVIRGVEALAKR